MAQAPSGDGRNPGPSWKALTGRFALIAMERYGGAPLHPRCGRVLQTSTHPPGSLAGNRLVWSGGAVCGGVTKPAFSNPRPSLPSTHERHCEGWNGLPRDWPSTMCLVTSGWFEIWKTGRNRHPSLQACSQDGGSSVAGVQSRTKGANARAAPKLVPGPIVTSARTSYSLAFALLG